jgi:hypothetical protein
MSPQSKQSTSSSVQLQLATLADQHSKVDELSGSQSVAAVAASGSSRGFATASASQRAKSSGLCDGANTGVVVGFATDGAEVSFVQYR